MTLIKCPACGVKVSNMAEDCPACGHPICGNWFDRFLNGLIGIWWIWVVLLIIVGGFVILISGLYNSRLGEALGRVPEGVMTSIAGGGTFLLGVIGLVFFVLVPGYKNRKQKSKSVKRFSNNGDKIESKCPNCNKVLSENEIVRGFCRSCKKVFELQERNM